MSCLVNQGCGVDACGGRAVRLTPSARTRLEPAEPIVDHYLARDLNSAARVTLARPFAERTRNGVLGDARLASVGAGEATAAAVIARTCELVLDFAQRPVQPSRISQI